VLLHNINS